MNTKINNKVAIRVISFLFPLSSFLFASCESGEQDFPDFDYQTVYFAKQYPVRTVELGNDDYVDLTLDNQHKIMIKATMGGAYDNRHDITVNFTVDPSLCEGATFKDTGDEVAVMPESYYQLASNQIVIPAGEISAGVEVQLTDALKQLALVEPVWAYCFEGKRYDVGDKLGFLKATVEFALRRPDLGGPFRSYLEELMKE